MTHTPLHLLTAPGNVQTAGRLRKKTSELPKTESVGSPDAWQIYNAHRAIDLHITNPIYLNSQPVSGQLVAARGYWNGACLQADELELVFTPSIEHFQPTNSDPEKLPLGKAVRARSELNAKIRNFFAQQDFLEVETPGWVESAGTDIYLNPFEAQFRLEASTYTLDGHLHTSPEFAMKRLLCQGFERIYQLTRVWRNGEVTDLHNPEFTILEWYRAWQNVEDIIQDVENITRIALHNSARPVSDAPFLRLTMREAVERSMHFDLYDALDFDSLHAIVRSKNLLGPRAGQTKRWDDLFFELVITYLDPYLAKIGPTFITEWPAELAVLARKKPDDPRVAERFELYIDGLELANGFGELTDPVEQTTRFQHDLVERKQLERESLPLPRGFLQALHTGMPPSAGVALGVDRLLMLATGARTISEVLPFALRRNPETGNIDWP